jgi:cytochrome P450
MDKNLIGNGLLALLRHPEGRRRLQGDPGLLHGAIEEILRYDGPVQRTSRTLAVERPTWRPSSTLQGLEKLPVVLGPPGA